VRPHGLGVKPGRFHSPTGHYPRPNPTADPAGVREIRYARHVATSYLGNLKNGATRADGPGYEPPAPRTPAFGNGPPPDAQQGNRLAPAGDCRCPRPGRRVRGVATRRTDPDGKRGHRLGDESVVGDRCERQWRRRLLASTGTGAEQVRLRAEHDCPHRQVCRESHHHPLFLGQPRTGDPNGQQQLRSARDAWPQLHADLVLPGQRASPLRHVLPQRLRKLGCLDKRSATPPGDQLDSGQLCHLRAACGS
jgi:hypothetical protein